MAMDVGFGWRSEDLEAVTLRQVEVEGLAQGGRCIARIFAWTRWHDAGYAREADADQGSRTKECM